MIQVADIPGYQPDAEEERKYTLLMIIIFALLVLIPVVGLIWLGVMISRIR